MSLQSLYIENSIPFHSNFWEMERNGAEWKLKFFMWKASLEFSMVGTGLRAQLIRNQKTVERGLLGYESHSASQRDKGNPERQSLSRLTMLRELPFGLAECYVPHWGGDAILVK
jgi:hypothetical protein